MGFSGGGWPRAWRAVRVADMGGRTTPPQEPILNQLAPPKSNVVDNVHKLQAVAVQLRRARSLGLRKDRRAQEVQYGLEGDTSECLHRLEVWPIGPLREFKPCRGVNTRHYPASGTVAVARPTKLTLRLSPRESLSEQRLCCRAREARRGRAPPLHVRCTPS